MSDQTFSLSGFSPVNTDDIKAETIQKLGFTHKSPNDIQIPNIQGQEFIHKAPGGVSSSATEDYRVRAEDTVKNYLLQSEDPESETSKIEVSQFLSEVLGTSFNNIYNNFTPSIEKILGQTMEPKKASTFIRDQFTTEKINMKIADLYTEIERKPGQDNQSVYNEIDRLEGLKPPYDPYKHNILIDSTGIAAGMIPYMWELGKYVIPGAVIGVAGGLISGGTGTVATAAAVTQKVGQLVSIFGRVASFAEGYKKTNGMLFGDLLKLKDDEGNPIDEDIARRISLGASIPIAAVEAIGAEFALTRSTPISRVINKLGKKAFNNLLEKSAAKTITGLTIKGNFAKFALDLAKHTGETFLYEVAGEEVPQGLMQMQATEMAKNITNDLYDTGFVEATPEEWKAMVSDTIIQATKGVLVLQLPSFIAKQGMSLRQSRKIKADQIKAEESAKKLDETMEEAKTYAESDNPEVIDFIDKMAEDDLRTQEYEKISTDISDNKATVKRGNGDTIGSVNFTENENTVLIDNIEGIDTDSKVSEVVNDIRKKFPTKKVVFSAEGISQSTFGRLTEDQNPDIARQNVSIDDAKNIISSSETTIKGLEQDIVDLQQEREEATDERIKEIDTALEQRQGEIADERESIDLANEQIQRSIDAKAFLTEKPQKPVEQMTAEEYKAENPVQRFQDSEIGQNLSKEIESLSAMDKEESDIAVGIIEEIAKAKNISPEKWITQTFKDKVVTKQKKGETRASVEPIDDFKVLIKLSKESDFKSWVHEIGHVLRMQLSDEDLAVATKWAEKESGTKAKNGKWSRKMEEVFAEGFVKYLKEEHVNADIDSIFKKIALFLKDLFENVLGIGELSEDIKQVYQNQILPLAEQEQRMELFDPGHKEAIKKAVDEGRYVPDKVLEQLPNEEWATNEIEKRKQEQAILSDMDWLKDIALDAKDVDDFINEANIYMGENIDQLEGKDAEWYKEFYRLATREESIVDINTGNEQWKAQVNEDYVKSVVIAASYDVETADENGIPASIVMAARRYLSKGTISAKRIAVIEKTLKNNPEQNRSLISKLIGDTKEINKVELERSYSEAIGVEEEVTIKQLTKERRDLADELSDAELKKLVQTKQLTDKQAEKLMGRGAKEIRDIRGKIAETVKAIKDLEVKHDQKLDLMINSRKKELKEQAIKLKNALRDQKAELKDKEKARKEKSDARKYMLKLGGQITKDIPSSVDATFRGVLLRLKGKVDPKFRMRAKVEEKISLREFYQQNPDIASIMPKGFINEIEAKSLNEWTILELEALNAKIKAIENKGKAKLKERKFIQQMKDTDSIQKTEGQLYSKGTIPEEAYTKVEKETLKEKGERALLKAMRANRMADMLDAGKGTKGEQYNGPIYRMIWDGITDAHNNEVREKHRREENIKAKAKEFGIGRFTLHEKVKAFGKNWSKDEILDLYAGRMNEHKYNLITENNKITEDMQQELISHLSENEKRFADAIIDDYSESFLRYAEAYYLHKNIILNHENFYTPIRVLLEGMTEKEMDMREEMLFRAKQYPSLRRAATNKRVAHNHPIKLGLYDTWVGAMAEEEHYINNAEAVRHIARVLGSKEVATATKRVGKTPVLKELQQWLNRYVSPLENKSTRGWDPMVRVLKKNAGMAYLFASTTTMIKQLPSAVYMLGYAGPKMWSKQFLTPIGAIEFKKTRNLMEKHSPELIYERSIDQYQRSIKAKTSSVAGDFARMIGEAGLSPIQWMDKQVITRGWRAVFDSYQAKNYSEDESARKATQAVLLTQPASGVKDTAAIYSDDNMLSIINMFTNQLNQMFNMISYDIPQSVKHEQVGLLAGQTLGLMLGAAAIWMISNRRRPEDKKDYIDMFSEQFLSTVPVVGKVMASQIEGYDMSIPAFAPFSGAAALGGLGLDLLKGEKISEQHLLNELWTAYEGAGVLYGLPVTFAKRTAKGIEEGHLLENILAGGEINKEKTK